AWRTADVELRTALPPGARVEEAAYRLNIVVTRALEDMAGRSGGAGRMIRRRVIRLRRRDGRGWARGRRARPPARAGGPACPRARAHARVPRPRARRGAGAVGRG